MIKPTTKPTLACDWDPLKIKEWPVIAMPKIDGVRGLALDGPFTGRSLKRLANLHTNTLFNKPEFAGMDGELTAGVVTHPNLCSMTTSATSSVHGCPQIVWNVFDLIDDQTRDLPYIERLNHLAIKVRELKEGPLGKLVDLVPWMICNNLEELLAFDDENLEAGFEGTVYRDPKSKVKHGRSTLKGGELIRIKRFMEANALVDNVLEGNKNGNVAQTNELGKTFRSSHKENMVPNGMIGTLVCTLLEDVFDAHSKKLLLRKGDPITVSPGNMTEAEARAWFLDQSQIVKHVIKFKFFPKGIKDKPRFPTYVVRRPDFDLVAE